jgi:hypothetical protein
MRMRLSVLFVGTLIACVVMWVTWVLVANGPGISFENFQRIKKGMSQEEVEQLLAGAPRWEVNARNPDESLPFLLRANTFSPAEWWGRRGVIKVYYDNTGNVGTAIFQELPFEPEPPKLWDLVLPRR